VIPRGPKGSEKQPSGHTSHVLCLAVSSDGKYLVSIVICRQVATEIVHVFVLCHKHLGYHL